MLRCPKHKGWNYFQVERSKLYEKENSHEFDFKYFFKENMKTWIKTFTMSIYPKIS